MAASEATANLGQLGFGSAQPHLFMREQSLDGNGPQPFPVAAASLLL
jgi:hypothetical protein